MPEKSKIVNRLLHFMDEGDVIVVAKLGDKVYANFVQVDKVAPEVSLTLFKRAADDLLNLGRKFLNLIDSHDDNV